MSTEEEKREVYSEQHSVDNSTDDDLGRLGPAPTDEDLATLPKVIDKLSWATWLVALVELCERFTYYGITGPFQNYMQLERDNGHQTGGLGLGQQTSTALNYFFQFWCYVTPIAGAILADKYIGKYNALLVCAIIYACGNFVLFMTSLPFALDNGAGMGGLIAAMVIIGTGTGGIKANCSTLIADQYTNTKPYVKTTKKGKRVICDPNVTYQMIFLIFYFCINCGSLSVIATTFMEKEIDFYAAFALPFAFFFVGIVALILGRHLYIKKPAEGSVIPDTFRICFIALKNKGDINAAKPGNMNRQVSWNDRFVEEVRRALIACKVFCFYPLWWLIYGQMTSNFVSQAGQMNLHGIPNDVLQSINSIAILLFIPCVNYGLYPLLRKVNIQMRPMTRIFCGWITASIAMAYAAIVQHLIYQAGPCYEYPNSDSCKQPNDIHVAIQAPAYALIAMAEIFCSVTGLEYAYTKAPANMKSFIMALYLLTNAVGSALGMALSSVSVNPKLVWLYVGLCGAMFTAAIIFWFVFKKYNAQEDELNAIDADYRAEQVDALKHGNKVHDDENGHPVATTTSSSA